MRILLKVLGIIILLLCITIIILYFDSLKRAVMKELFFSTHDASDFGDVGDIDIILQGDMKSEGGMSNLDNLDGTGTGPMGSGFNKENTVYQPYPDLSGGTPDGSYAPGPPGGLSLDSVNDAGGSGPEKSAYQTGGGPLPNIPDKILGVQPTLTKPYEELAHGTKTYNEKAPDGEHGDISKPSTYYYLEGDNINRPCKNDKDCGNTQCSESGFCRY
jgi:hypothetical protein